jgi:hypothetical protein
MGQMGRDEDVRFLVAPSVLLYPILFLNIKHLKYFVLYFHPSPAFTRPDPAAWRKVIESRGSLERGHVISPCSTTPNHPPPQHTLETPQQVDVMALKLHHSSNRIYYFANYCETVLIAC